MTQVSDFHCVTGWTVKNVHWTGVRITDIFAKVKPTPEAHALAVRLRGEAVSSTT